MNTTTKAIVLTHSRVGENGHLLHLYSQLNGPISVMVRGGKRAALRQVLMQPLSLVELVIQQTPRQPIASVKEGIAYKQLTDLPYSPVKCAIALYMAELLDMVLKEQTPDETLYQFLETAVIKLDQVKDKYANYHLVFTIKLTQYLGIFPNLSHFEEGVYFDLMNGIFTTQVPIHSHFLNQDDSLAFAYLMRSNFDNMAHFVLNRTQRQHILAEMMHYYQLHVSGVKELNSIPILEQLFD